MIPPFDIYRAENDGQLKWKALAETLDVARLRINVLMASEPGDYVVHSQQTGHKMTIKADGSITGSTGEDR